MGNSKMTAQQTLVALKKEMKDIDRTRKTYTRQSEWHRMMYERTMRIESLEMFIRNFIENETTGH